jgi:NRPS condensation-like uncharacterized protein
MPPLPQRYPSVCTDLAAAMLRGIGEMMIQMELEFDEPLDVGRLTKALALAMDAEPVLGCRLVEHPRRPYWERLPDPAKDVLVIAPDDAAYDAFVHRTAIAAEGPQLEACLQRTATGDRLCLKLSHEAGDAAGVKDTAALVAGFYRRLRREPDWRPEPNLLGSRGIWQLVRRIPLRGVLRIQWNNLVGTAGAMIPLFTHKLPWQPEPRGPMRVLRRHLPAARVARLAEYGRARGATINDLCIAAYYRAHAEVGGWNGRDVLRLGHTVDLRRYLPRKTTEAVCNLSGVEHHRLGRELGADYAATLAKVSAAMQRRKASWFGLNDYVGLFPVFGILFYKPTVAFFRRVFAWLAARHNMENSWTNMGPIDPESVIFEDRPRAAWLLVPPMHPPNFLVGLSGFAGSLTITAGSYPESGRPGLAGDFLDALVAELPNSE